MNEARERYVVREIFQSQLQEVQARLVEIAEDSARVMEKASKAFNTSDVVMADEAIAISELAGEKALALDELVAQLAILRQERFFFNRPLAFL